MMLTWQRSTSRKAKGGSFKGRHDQRVEDEGKTMWTSRSLSVKGIRI